MPISESKIKLVMDNYFKKECNVNTSIYKAFEKGFRIGVKKGYDIGLRDKMEWTSVNDALPKEKMNPITNDFEYVLCATTFGDVRAYKYGTPIGWDKPHFWNGCGIMDEYITHWMPIPEMPTTNS